MNRRSWSRGYNDGELRQDGVGNRLSLLGMIPESTHAWTQRARFAEISSAPAGPSLRTGSLPCSSFYCLCRTGGLRHDHPAHWNGSAPTIASFTANPTSITSGTSSTLSWTVTGATSIAITPGTFTSTSATGSTSVSPTATTTYTLTATNAVGSTTATLSVTVTTAKQTDHRLLYRESHKHHFGFQQHAELGDDRCDEHRHHAGDLHVHIGEWFDEREPDGDDHLHADRDQCRGLDHVYGDRYRNRGKQTDDRAPSPRVPQVSLRVPAAR